MKKLFEKYLRLEKKIKSKLKMINRLFFNRRFINSSKDTGYLIEKKFSNRRYKKQLLKPVVEFKDSFPMAHLKTKLGRKFESCLPQKFSYLNSSTPLEKQLSCHMTYTSPEVHDLLREGFHRSPMFNGRIKSVGPRYCPSIEDKIHRFSCVLIA